jgi:hypothetical protein
MNKYEIKLTSQQAFLMACFLLGQFYAEGTPAFELSILIDNIEKLRQGFTKKQEHQFKKLFVELDSPEKRKLLTTYVEPKFKKLFESLDKIIK